MKLLLIRAFTVLGLCTVTMTASQVPTATLLAYIDGPERRLGELTEGAVGYFRVLRNGVVFLEKQALGRPSGFRGIWLDLPAGEYELISYVRGPLMRPTGPPLDECSGSFSIKDRETLYASRIQTPQGKCSLLFSPSKPTLREKGV